MKKGTLRLLIAVFLLALAAGLAIVEIRLESDRTVHYDYASDVESVSEYDEVLRFAGGTDFSPFVYLDKNGVPGGHDVELAFAIGRELGCRVEITLGDWTEMQEGILNGTYDVLMTVDYSEERSKIMGYTSPVCLDSYVFFGKDTGIDPDDLSVLSKLRIAALDGGGATDNYLLPLGLVENTTFYPTQVEAFQAVEKGECDIAIAGYIYGSNVIAGMDADLKQLGSPLYGSAYYFTYDVSRTDIGPKLNSALASLESDGTMSAIESKWTTHYQPNLSLAEYITQNRSGVLMGSFVVVITVLFAWTAISLSNARKEKTKQEHDALTGLLNMHAFHQHMAQLVRKNPGKQYVLVRFDLDNFKTFNSTQGTDAGDRLLRNIAGGLTQSRAELIYVDLIGYLGADHFAILADKGLVSPDPELLMNYLKALVEKACPGFLLPVRAGICVLDEPGDTDSTDGTDGTDAAEYSDRALIALRSVKNNYYRRWAYYDNKIREKLNREKMISEKMFSALENGHFVPYFQPQYDFTTGKICGAEALVRWIDPEQGVISPGDFVPVFESNGFIYEMDKAIWRETCRKICRWKQLGIMLDHVSVNISRSDLYHSNLVSTIRSIVEEEDVHIKDLRLEITESAYLEDSKLLLDTIEKLHAYGAWVEMDDFGSGYSSLSSLKEMDCETLKIDMGLVRNNSLTGKDAAILASVIRLGKELGMELIAEGVEQQKQAEYLHSLGCDVMQGYLYSRPVPADLFEEMLRAQSEE